MTAAAVLMAWGFDHRFPWYVWAAVGLDTLAVLPMMLHDLLFVGRLFFGLL